jgi:hypothetical protein
MKAYGGVDIQNHVFLTLALVGSEWSASRPCRFTPSERTPSIHWIGGWVGPRASLDGMEKLKFLTLLVLELRLLSCPVHSQSLYRLRYCSSHCTQCAFILFYFFFGEQWSSTCTQHHGSYYSPRTLLGESSTHLLTAAAALVTFQA